MRRLVAFALLMGLVGSFGCCHDTCDCCNSAPCSMTTGGPGCGGCGGGMPMGHISPMPATMSQPPVMTTPAPAAGAPVMPNPAK
jgi:hypothetical protein